MLVIFPFEEAIYRAAGVPVTYIGHPLAETIPMVPDQDAARVKLGLPLDARVVTVMPGSRTAELKYLAVPYMETVKLLAARDPSLRFIAPMAGPKQRAQFTELVAAAGLQDVAIGLIDGDAHTAIAAADTVLVASGTATLEVALHKKPMVIAYKVVWASWQLMRHMGYLPWIGLPNILAREFLVPELLQDAVTPAAMAEAVWRQLEDTAGRARLVQRFTDMHHSLLRNSAQESADAVMRIIQTSKQSAS
jgi:lipid-A-disaccharide synthase